MKLSVSMWSVVHPVRAGQMDLAGFVDFVAGQDAEGVELLDYFWKDKESELPKVKKQIADAGLELAVYSVGNDFFQPDRAVWAQQLADMKTGIDTANALEVGLPKRRASAWSKPSSSARWLGVRILSKSS